MCTTYRIAVISRVILAYSITRVENAEGSREIDLGKHDPFHSDSAEVQDLAWPETHIKRVEIEAISRDHAINTIEALSQHDER